MELEQLTERLDRLTRLVERGIAAIEGLSTQLQAQQSAPPADADQLWTVREVAAFLQCSTSKVYRAAEEGQLPRLMIGGQLRFEPEAVRAHAKGQALPPARVLSMPTRH